MTVSLSLLVLPCDVCGRRVPEELAHAGHRDDCRYDEVGFCWCDVWLCPGCCPCDVVTESRT